MNGGTQNNQRPLAFWLEKLTVDVFPILRRSRDVLLEMERDMDRLTDDAIAKQIYHDPFLVANVLRRVAKLPRRGLAGEVTTLDRAVMMLGMQPFFLWIKTLPVLEETLKGKTPILQRLYAVLACSYHAAHLAWQWSLLRKDINADEVLVATLLQNRVLWAGWLLLPGEFLLIEQTMRRERLNFAAAFSRHTDYLFDDVQKQLAKKWGLPDAYIEFNQGHNAIRAQGVMLAATLSDIMQRGWWQEAVAKTDEQIAEWLNQPVADITAKTHSYSAQAARLSEGWYGTAAAIATWLPMLPGEWPDESTSTVSLSRVETRSTVPVAAPAIEKNPVVVASARASDTHPRQTEKPALIMPPLKPAAMNHVVHPEVVARIVADIKAHLDGSFDIGQLMSRVLMAMHDGLAFDRVVFALLSADKTLKARFSLGVEADSPMKVLNFSLQEKHLFSQLMNKMQAVWFHAPTQAKLSPFLLPNIRAQIGRGEFMAMSVHVHDKPLGFFYADYGDNGHMDENVYAGFKQLCTLTAEGMAHLSKKPKA